jgi:hypothetical protein
VARVFRFRMLTMKYIQRKRSDARSAALATKAGSTGACVATGWVSAVMVGPASYVC